MARKFRNCKCIHCLQYFAVLTSDHVFPKSWFPDSTPENIERWQAPACPQCNNELGRIEEKFFLYMGLCINPFKAATCGIPQKVWRALDHKKARDLRDAENRNAKKLGIIKKTIPAASIPQSAMINCLNPESDTSKLALTIEVGVVNRVIEKIIRGATWVISGDYIGSNYNIEVRPLNSDDTESIVDGLIGGNRRLYQLGPGFRIYRADRGRGIIYKIEIWGEFKFCGLVALVEK